MFLMEKFSFVFVTVYLYLVRRKCSTQSWSGKDPLMEILGWKEARALGDKTVLSLK
jgi:hypothetical protein